MKFQTRNQGAYSKEHCPFVKVLCRYSAEGMAKDPDLASCAVSPLFHKRAKSFRIRACF
jgi:hypothetical protein